MAFDATLPLNWTPFGNDTRSGDSEKRLELAARNMDNLHSYYAKPEAESHLKLYLQQKTCTGLQIPV